MKGFSVEARTAEQLFYYHHPILKRHPLLLDKVIENFRGFQGVRFFKAPGRVNMIGEHTDYNMGPVLPCALDREIVFAVRLNDRNRIHIANVEPGFEPVACYLSQNIDPYPRGHWGNYLKAGFKGVLDFRSLTEKSNGLIGFDALVSGNIPRAAGLSSSSALVVATVISFLSLNRIEMPKMQVAELCAEAEHFVGTAGGGMDQAVSLLAQKDALVKIDFNPLRTEIVPVPAGIAILIFDSLVKAEKSGFARAQYNRRVVECKLGMALFKKFLQKKAIASDGIDFIGQIQPELLRLDKNTIDRLVTTFLNSLAPDYSLADLAPQLNESDTNLADTFLKIGSNDYLTEPTDGFKIRGRFRHVYTECQRVEASQKCLLSGDVAGFGQLMSASQQSMAQDYEISTPEIDQLTRAIMAAGGYGARLTGAGFGGAVVAIVAQEQVPSLREQVYQDHYREKNIPAQDAPIWVCQPSDGAGEIVLA